MYMRIESGTRTATLGIREHMNSVHGSWVPVPPTLTHVSYVIQALATLSLGKPLGSVLGKE